MPNIGFIFTSIRSNSGWRAFAFSVALVVSLICGLSLAADRQAQVNGTRPSTTAAGVKKNAAEGEQSTRALFPATRYPFLPSLVEDREPELCATVLKGARERFFSSDFNPRMTGEARDGMTWLTWGKGQEGGIEYRLDLDLDGTGRIQPVVGRHCSLPGGRDGSEFFVFPSLGSLNKGASDTGCLHRSSGCTYIYASGKNELPANPDAPVMYYPIGILAGVNRERIGTGRDWLDHRLFRWQDRYYFFSEPYPREYLNSEQMTTFRLQADGTVDRRCVVCLVPDKAFLASFRGLPGISAFLKVISTIGKQGGYCRACSDHDGGANAAVDRAAYRPWAVSRAASDPALWGGSYFRYDERMKRFLQDWSLLEVWNRREYQTLLQHLDPALAALEKYYASTYGLAKEEATKAARRVIEEIIAAWLLVPDGYDPDRNLHNVRRPLLNRPIFTRDTKALEEEIKREKERWADGSSPPKRPSPSDPVSPSVWDRKQPEVVISLAVHEAVEWEEGMRLLLAAGADSNAPNDFGKTPLMTAAHMNRPDTVRLLLSHGADPNRKTLETKSEMGNSLSQRTALMYAAENAGTLVMKLLLDAGARWDEVDSNGDDVGHYLARNPRLTEAEKRMDVRELVRLRSGRPDGPGFDCNEAQSQLEKAICGDEVLKMLDGEMADEFSRWVRVGGDKARDDQRRWLRERGTSCTKCDKALDVGCLQDQTRSRVRYLHNRLAENQLNQEKPRN